MQHGRSEEIEMFNSFLKSHNYDMNDASSRNRAVHDFDRINYGGTVERSRGDIDHLLGRK